MKKFSDLSDVKDYLGVGYEPTAKLLITPQQAKYLLDHSNRINRSMKTQHVETLRRDMESGNWYSDIDYIGFNQKGILINGQHRLKALSEAKVDSVLLKFDFDVDQHVSMDTGNSRKYTDQILISKKMGVDILSNKYRYIIVAGLKLNDYNMKLSNSELWYIWNEYGADLDLCDSHGLFNLGEQALSTVKSSLFWAYLSGVAIETLARIAKVLRTGITEGETDIPVIRLRDALVDLRGPGKAREIKRAEYTQQCIWSVLQGSTSNRLSANPIMHYQNYPFMDRIRKAEKAEEELALT